MEHITGKPGYLQWRDLYIGCMPFYLRKTENQILDERFRQAVKEVSKDVCMFLETLIEKRGRVSRYTTIGDDAYTMLNKERVSCVKRDWMITCFNSYSEPALLLDGVPPLFKGRYSSKLRRAMRWPRFNIFFFIPITASVNRK